jgi:hypothetical protein
MQTEARGNKVTSEAEPKAFAKRMRSHYAFAGTNREIDKTLPLVRNEQVLEDGSIRLRWGLVLQRQGRVRLSEPRLVVLAHYAFRADRVVEIPAGALEEVRASSLAWTRLTFRTETGPASLDFKPLALSPSFSASLQAWLARSRGDAAGR